MNMTDQPAIARESAHAKLLTYGERQVLAYLYRNQDDRLTVVMQLWVAKTDEQLRIELSTGDGLDSDGRAQIVFGALNDFSLAATLEAIGVPAILAEVEGS
jgi:hypothetical protein